METKENKLKYLLGKLLTKVNVVTAAHRHSIKITNKALDDLSNRQIEIEQQLQLYEKEEKDTIITMKG